jgi:hypothetical protein
MGPPVYKGYGTKHRRENFIFSPQGGLKPQDLPTVNSSMKDRAIALTPIVQNSEIASFHSQ